MHQHTLPLNLVYEARNNIQALIVRSPLVRSPVLSAVAGASVYLKLENLQETGSFKIRGAANKLRNLSPEEQARGVVTASSGNHGRALAWVSRQTGIHCVVCLSTRVPRNKVEAIRDLGAEVVVQGDSYDEAAATASHLQEQRGLTMVSSYDDLDVIAGQGTLALELLEDLPSVGAVIVPFAGGGLISGIAVTMKAASPAVRVIGVTTDRAPVMHHSLGAGRILQLPEEDSIADCLVGGLGDDNRYTFPLMQRHVDLTVPIPDEEIADAMLFMLEKHRMVIEGGAAAGIAALLHRRIHGLTGNVVVVVTGNNVDPSLVYSAIQQRRQSHEVMGLTA